MRVNKKGYTITELLAVILILSIISLIALAVKVNLDKSIKSAYYKSLEGTVSLSGQNYFSDNIDERPEGTEFASLIEINNRNSTNDKNLSDKTYVSRVLDMKRNDCPGKVIAYKNVDRGYEYVTCLECGQEYNSSSKNRICDCKVEKYTDEATGEEYSVCKLDEIPKTTLKVVYLDNPKEEYKVLGITYDEAIWTSRDLRITYTTTYKYATKIRVIDDEGKLVSSMSCDLTGTTTKTCSKELKNTIYGTFTAYVVDDLNRASFDNGQEFPIKLDKTEPKVIVKAYNTLGQEYVDGTSNRNINLKLTVDPKMAPSGYTYKWYYSKDLANGTNKVLITQVNEQPTGEITVQVPVPVKTGDGEVIEQEEITNVDTDAAYTLDKNDMSLFINAVREKIIKRKYILEITTGAGKKSTSYKNITIRRPKAICTITAKDVNGRTITSNSWANKDVILTANINNASFGVKKWVKKNISTGVDTTYPGTQTTYKVTSISSNLGDKYTAFVALADNTEEEECEAFVVKIDKDDPKCGTVSGASKTWTDNSRKISVKCSDALSGCTASSFSHTFKSTTKTGSITIKDKAGNTKACSVNVYVDKTDPTISWTALKSYETVVGWTAKASDSHSGAKRLDCVSGTCNKGTTLSAGTGIKACVKAYDYAGNSKKSCKS